MSPPLRALLIRLLATVALLHWGTFSGFAAGYVARARKSRGVHWWLAGFGAVASRVLALFATFGSNIGALVPMWVAALLAALGTFELRRTLRLPLRA